MIALPARFPRTALINSAGQLEARIQALLDETHQKIREAEDRGMGTVSAKLAERFITLDEARARCNDLRQILWQLK